MATGNFSNGGLDTFDEHKHYIGIRLQQGVPVLDRDWNELEDIRRWFERSLGREYLGAGVPGPSGFEVTAPSFPSEHDVLIGAGHCLVDGYDLWNEKALLFSEQGGRAPLPATATAGDTLTLYLTAQVTRVDATDDPALANNQDIHLETCVRDRLDWSVGVVRAPAAPPAGAYVLADIVRPSGTKQISTGMIHDRRRTGLRLSAAVDRLTAAEDRLTALETALAAVKVDIENLKHDVGTLFWNIEAGASSTQVLFGEKVMLSFRAVDRLGTPVAGATLHLSSDWGTLQPPVATTGADGRAMAHLVGVQTWGPLNTSEIGRLDKVARKVSASMLPNPGAIQYRKVRLDSSEMALLSKFTPSDELADLIGDLPEKGPIVAQPYWRTVTVTIHAKEGATVRGTGSVQVTFGHWVRDWAVSKLWEVASKAKAGSRVGDVMRQGVDEGMFNHDVVIQKLPLVLQGIHDQTYGTIKDALFADPHVSDEEVKGSGRVGQVITQEANALIGASTVNAIAIQLEQLGAEGVTVPPESFLVLHQAASQAGAGFDQNAKLVFGVKRAG